MIVVLDHPVRQEQPGISAEKSNVLLNKEQIYLILMLQHRHHRCQNLQKGKCQVILPKKQGMWQKCLIAD